MSGDPEIEQPQMLKPGTTREDLSQLLAPLLLRLNQIELLLQDTKDGLSLERLDNLQEPILPRPQPYTPLRNTLNSTDSTKSLIRQPMKSQSRSSEMIQVIPQDLLQQLQQHINDLVNLPQIDFSKERVYGFELLHSVENKKVIDVLALITMFPGWHKDAELINLVWSLYCKLSPAVGVVRPERNYFCVGPQLFLVHLITCTFYYLIGTILLFIMLLSNTEHWVSIILGMAGATLSSIAARDGLLITVNGTLAASPTSSASIYLGIVTGVFLLAKGVTLAENLLPSKPEYLTMKIRRDTYGKEDGLFVFQRIRDQRPYELFSKDLNKKVSTRKNIVDCRLILSIIRSSNMLSSGSSYLFIEDSLIKLCSIEESLMRLDIPTHLEDMQTGPLGRQVHYLLSRTLTRHGLAALLSDLNSPPRRPWDEIIYESMPSEAKEPDEDVFIGDRLLCC